jgi:hypothetical protein
MLHVGFVRYGELRVHTYLVRSIYSTSTEKRRDNNLRCTVQYCTGNWATRPCAVSVEECSLYSLLS